MKNSNNSSVDVGGASAGVDSGPDVGSGPSVGAGDLGVNELDELAILAVLLVGGGGGSVWH